MSGERHHESGERNERLTAELEASRQEKLAELRNSTEQSPDDAAERAQEARKFIHEQDKHREQADHTEAAPEPAPKPRFIIDAKENYRQTMASVQRSLKPVSRTFSKFIHTPAVEKTSEILEKTVARPSVTAGATWTALIVGAVFYFTARWFGYTLSGSEMLFSFIIGAGLGLILEGLWRAYKHH